MEDRTMEPFELAAQPDFRHSRRTLPSDFTCESSQPYASRIRRRCASPNTIMWSRLCLLKTSRSAKLSDFRRICVENRKIRLQMKFLGRRRRPFRLSATREDRNAARAQRRLVEAHGKQDRGDAAEGRDAGDGGS